MNPSTNDPQATPAAGTTTPPASDPAPSAGGKQSPLAILEEILDESKKASSAQDAAQEQKATEAAQLAEAKANMAAKIEQDQTLIQQQLAQLQTIQDTPQYQARMTQEEAKKDQAEDSQDGLAGHEIRQIKHTKI
jgi:hypothetical protein